jgi:hypothetical protein
MFFFSSKILLFRFFQNIFDGLIFFYENQQGDIMDVVK